MKNTFKSLPIVAGTYLTMFASRALAVGAPGTDPGVKPPTSLGTGSGSDLDTIRPSGSSTDLLANIKVITNTLILGVGIVAVIMLIIGAFRYVLSQGNEKAVTGAKDTIVYAIIGIIVAIISYAVVNFVIGQFTPANATP